MTWPFNVIVAGGDCYDSETGAPADLADGNAPPRPRRNRRRPIAEPGLQSGPGLFEPERIAEADS